MNQLISALIQRGAITETQYKEAKVKHLDAKNTIPLQELMVEMGFITENSYSAIAAEVFNIEIADMSEKLIDSQATTVIKYETAKRYGVFPLKIAGEVLVLQGRYN
jgi:hypothetical protein